MALKDTTDSRRESETNEVKAGFTNDPELLGEGFKTARFGAEPVILIRIDKADYRAFTATCTHLDCIVDYRQEKKLIWCWCHNGVYDLTGCNIAGPAPRPLTPFHVHLVSQGDGRPQEIVISKA